MSRLVRRGSIVAVAALVALALRGTAPAGAEDARPSWAAELEALRVERDPAKRHVGANALLGKRPEAAALLAELARPVAYKPDARTGMFHWEREVPGAGTLTVFAYVPKAYTPQKAWPVLVWMHGAVGRDADGGGLSGLGMLEDVAEAQGFLLLSPSATGAATWWSARGAAHLKEALLELAATHRVDPTRIAAAGFSDGGSGCFHLLAHAPDPYGCFVSMMGNPNVSRLAGGPTFGGNLGSRPVWAINGGLDQLYPSEQMKPVMEELQKAGAALTWESLPEAGHDPGAALGRLEAVFAFWAQHPREALPAKVDWATATPALDGRRGWLEIVSLSADAKGDASVAAQPLALPSLPRRARLGISIDQEHEGEGIAVERVEPGTPAAEAGFQPGDVLVRVGEKPLTQGGEAFQALRSYLEGLGDADGVFGIKRGAETFTLRARPRQLKQDEPSAELGYGQPAGRVVGQVKPGNVIELESHGVASLRLHLARPLVDPTQRLVVTLNGKQVYDGVPSRDPAYILGEALRTLPGDPLFEATVLLTP